VVLVLSPRQSGPVVTDCAIRPDCLQDVGKRVDLGRLPIHLFTQGRDFIELPQMSAASGVGTPRRLGV
jgi:hypothetical protein